LTDVSHVSKAIIDTLQELLKKRDDLIDELSRVNKRLQETNQDHINTITRLELDLEDSRTTAIGRTDVIEILEEKLRVAQEGAVSRAAQLDEQWQNIIVEQEKLKLAQEAVASRIAHLDLVSMRLSAKAARMGIVDP
jgi:DNA repair exonuclease SbcCD ATPase subunit